MKRFLFLAIVIAASLTSCSVEDEKAPVLENSAPVEQFKITATLGSDMTRTIYVDETSDPTKGLKVTWEASESISVIEINPDGYMYEKVYKFTSDNAEGATATFTAPLDFVYDSNKKYLAIYPSLEYNGDGSFYYSGDVAQPTFRLDEERDLNKLTSSFLPTENSGIYQGPDGVAHLKNYDAMFSIVEFDGTEAKVDFIKLNAVIKWELQFPDSAKGQKVYTFDLEARESKENHLRLYGQLNFWDIFKENRKS
ncbi:MAG: hypothetical protein J6Q12_09535, partial [Bacteroidales bacterium]|nr:hypothetical protein [Bacteroidales bacterium]